MSVWVSDQHGVIPSKNWISQAVNDNNYHLLSDCCMPKVAVEGGI